MDISLWPNLLYSKGRNRSKLGDSALDVDMFYQHPAEIRPTWNRHAAVELSLVSDARRYLPMNRLVKLKPTDCISQNRALDPSFSGVGIDLHAATLCKTMRAKLSACETDSTNRMD